MQRAVRTRDTTAVEDGSGPGIRTSSVGVTGLNRTSNQVGHRFRGSKEETLHRNYITCLSCLSHIDAPGLSLTHTHTLSVVPGYLRSNQLAAVATRGNWRQAAVTSKSRVTQAKRSLDHGQYLMMYTCEVVHGFARERNRGFHHESGIERLQVRQGRYSFFQSHCILRFSISSSQSTTMKQNGSRLIKPPKSILSDSQSSGPIPKESTASFLSRILGLAANRSS